MSTLTVVMTAHDSARTIGRAIMSVRDLAQRVVVVDSGSTDGTRELCRSLGAVVIDRPWAGHVPQKQFALEQCGDADWVLLLDSDEALEPDLAATIRAVLERDETRCDGWTINRKVWFLGGWLHHTYQPDRVLRLVRAGRAVVRGGGDPRSDPRQQIHERLHVEGPVGHLSGVCRHDSWADLPDLAARQILYARHAAMTARGGGTPLHLLVNPAAAMLKQLVLKGGFLDGTRGLLIAGLTFNATMLKHAFIAAERLRSVEAPRR